MGPLDEAAEVKDEWEPMLELEADDIELTRGDGYDWGGCGRGKDGNLSFTYNGRCGASEL